MNEAFAADGDRQIMPVRQCGGLAAQECREVAGHAGVLRVRQSHLRETRSPCDRGLLGYRHFWEEAVGEDFLKSLAIEFGFDGAADQGGSATCDRDGNLFCFRIVEESLF